VKRGEIGETEKKGGRALVSGEEKKKDMSHRLYGQRKEGKEIDMYMQRD